MTRIGVIPVRQPEAEINEAPELPRKTFPKIDVENLILMILDVHIILYIVMLM